MANTGSMKDVVKIVKSADGINRRIRALLYHNIPLKITFNSKPNMIFESKVLSTNSNKSQFIIRHMLPANGHALATDKESFTLTASLQGGITITIQNCKILKAVNYKGATGYLMDYPEEIEHNQQRDSFRAEVNAQSIVIIVNYAKRHKTYRANILDLSNTGCKAEFNTVIEPLFDNMEILTDAQIKFPDSHEFFPVQLEVRHSNIISKKTICGFRFENNTQLLQTQIDRNVNLMQIQARRIAKQKKMK